MEILFCDACDGSISRSEIEEGRVVRIGGRTYHAACAPAAARSPWRGGWSWVWTIVLPCFVGSVIGVSAVMLVGRAGRPERPAPRSDRSLARLEALEAQVRGLSAQLEAALAETRRQHLEIGEAVASRDAAIASFGDDLDLLAETLARLARTLAEPPPAPSDRDDGERLRTLLAEVTSTDFGTRFSAVRALALRPETEALRAVRGRLADPDRRIRVYALWLLGERADDGSVGEMVALLSDEDPAVRAAAHRALRLVSGMSFPFDALAPEAGRREQARAWEEWWQARDRERAEAVESGG